MPYLPVGIALLVPYTLFPGFSHGRRESSSVVTSLTLLPTNASPALSVGWTLMREIIFQALSDLFFITRKAFSMVITLWSSGILIVLRYRVSPLRQLFFIPTGLEFGIGREHVLSNKINGKQVCRSNNVAVWCLADGIASQRGRSKPCIACLGVCRTRHSVCVVHFDCSLARSALKSLGVASCSTYLVHNPLQYVLICMTHGRIMIACKRR